MTTADIEWAKFILRNPDTRYAFEELCECLFARYLGISPADLVVHKNQTGIECDPFKKGSKFWSFQAKFKDKGGIDFRAFRESIKKALMLKIKPGRYENLTHIICYSNKTPGENKQEQEIEEFSKAEGVTIKWCYGDAIIKRLREDQYSDLRKKYFGGGQDLDLIIPVSEATKTISALKFTAEVTKFIDRDEELDQLDNFMSSDDLVSWWAIEGPGASGKSRLALELCNKYSRNGWSCGFYDKDIAASSLTAWDPENPHLIIFDYVLKNEDEPKKLIKLTLFLMDKGKLCFPVRILLLDRDAKSSIQVMEQTRTFGEKIKGHQYSPNPMALGPLSTDDIHKMIIDFTEYFELSPENRQFVIDYTMNSDSTRKNLIAGLACLDLYQGKPYDHTQSREELIRSLIKGEREIHWRKLGFGKEQEKYLLIATIADGIDRQHTSSLGAEAKSFIEAFEFEEVYEKVVGQSATKRLTSLSHDIISELYVLDNYLPVNPLNKKQFNEAIQICLQVDGGRGLVDFFTRAANDWPNHPTLNLLLPRFGQMEDQYTVWLAVIANVIDKINIPIEEKLRIFSGNVSGLRYDNNSTFNKLKHMFEGFFLRLLRQASNNIELNKWVREYVVLDASTMYLPPSSKNGIPTIEINPDLKLRSDDYCRAVVSSFIQLDKKQRKHLIWDGLFVTYFHTILHTLTNRKAEPNEVSSLLFDIVETFNDNWSICIIFREVIAGLVQFNHIRRNPDSVVGIIDWMFKEIQKRKNKSGLASCFSAATTAFSLAGLPYDRKKGIILLFDDAFSKNIESDENIGTEFVGATVALMHGFRNRSDFDFASKLVVRAEHITDVFPNEKNVEHLSMALCQLARRVGDIASTAEADEFLSKAVSLARQHGKKIQKIAVSVVHEISSKYANEIRRDYQKAHTYFEMAIDLCEYFSSTDLGNNKLYLVGMLEGEFNYGLESSDFTLLRNLADKVSQLQQNQAVDISHFWPSTKSLFEVYISAKNNGDDNTVNEFVQVAEYWLEHLYDNSRVRAVFSYIVGEH